MCELEERSTFSQKIEYNSEICENCYRRVKTYIEPHSSLPDVVTEEVEYSNSAYFGYFDDRGQSGKASVKRSYCKCGNVDDAKIRPLDATGMMELACRVRNRLEEQNIEVDEDEFFEHVKDEIPEHRFNEEEVLEQAVSASE